jgi:outer membrane protein assembly factor BamB
MDGTVTAVKADTGSKLWSMDLQGPLLSSWQNDTVFNDITIIPNTGASHALCISRQCLSSTMLLAK